MMEVCDSCNVSYELAVDRGGVRRLDALARPRFSGGMASRRGISFWFAILGAACPWAAEVAQMDIS